MTKNEGKIKQVLGAVVDVNFEETRYGRIRVNSLYA